MLPTTLFPIFLLLATVCSTRTQMTARSSSEACNNSPSLCNRTYDNVTYLGAHDSPFVKDAATKWTSSGNQFYNSTVQLSAGVRLLTAQVQWMGSELHVCHTSCDLLDAGTLHSWLSEVRSWLESNPHNVVTILLVNGAAATAKQLGAQYKKADITTALAYTPAGSTAKTQTWPTLRTLIDEGTRLINFVDYIGDTSAAPYLMSEYHYIFENPYDVSSLSDFVCEANRPPSANGSTLQVIKNGVMPLMNHFLYQNDGFGIQQPNETAVNITNSPREDEVGTLGHSAAQCTQYYGRAPSYLLVDFFVSVPALFVVLNPPQYPSASKHTVLISIGHDGLNIEERHSHLLMRVTQNVGPALATADRLNGVTNPVGLSAVSEDILTSVGSMVAPGSWKLWSAFFALTLLHAARFGL